MKMNIIFTDFFNDKSLRRVSNWYFECKEFLMLIFQNSFSAEDIKKIDEQAVCLARTYLRLHRVIYEDEARITPKIHHTLHLSEAIQVFGPPRHSMTLRHEQKHQQTKSHIRTIRCRKNVGKSLVAKEVVAFEYTNGQEECERSRWSLKKNIVKQIIGTNKYFEVNSFSKDNKSATGNIYVVDRTNSVTKQKFLKLVSNSTNILLENLDFSKDFLYRISPTRYTLTGWPLH